MATATSELAAAPDLHPGIADLIGIPFKWGARGPDFFDCYGLVLELLARCGQTAPDYALATVQEEIAKGMRGAYTSSAWLPCEQGPGAVVTFRIGRHVSHVGFVLPHSRMVHAWEHSGGVCVERLGAWERRIAGFYRLADQ